jgi:hypothetical protein
LKTCPINPAAILIDLDGTLADSLLVMREAYRLFLDDFQVHGTDDEFSSLNGPPLVEVVRRLKVARWPWIDKLPAFTSFDELEVDRLETGLSLALMRPKQVLSLEITEARNAEWTDDEREKLLRYEMQGQLFSDTEVKKMTQTLRKVPFDFYYRYTCETPEGEKVFKHKIVDWEAGVLFWHCRQSHGIEWEKPFRAKLELDLTGKDLMFLMGNQHRFQDQWLIISLIYPPKRKPVEVTPQGSLF